MPKVTVSNRVPSRSTRFQAKLDDLALSGVVTRLTCGNGTIPL